MHCGRITLKLSSISVNPIFKKSSLYDKTHLAIFNNEK